MSLEFSAFIDLPQHLQPGGFDHAAVHSSRGRLYVAHTANNSLEVIDCVKDRYLRSIPGLPGVAGALVSEERDLVFTSNRGEDMVGVFSPADETSLFKIPVGVHPNGLAFDPGRSLLLAANVGNPDLLGSFTLSLVDIQRREMVSSIPVPGRTRWTVFAAQPGWFYVNIADPPQIIVIDAAEIHRIHHTIAIPAAGPHGLDLDVQDGRLFCACDGARLVVLKIYTEKATAEAELSGAPDVIFLNPALQRLYVAVGDPGVIDVFALQPLQRVETVPTEAGAHTLGFDPARNKVYAFLPKTHRAIVFEDRE
ncbi:MAG TPA: hypothetical protein VF498_18320 [Anaerolineales bacterium]